MKQTIPEKLEVTCDRCGFVTIGDASRAEEEENPFEGWRNIPNPNLWKDRNGYDLCGSCFTLFEEFFEHRRKA